MEIQMSAFLPTKLAERMQLMCEEKWTDDIPSRVRQTYLLSHRHGWLDAFILLQRRMWTLFRQEHSRRGVSISTPYPKCKIRRSPLALIPSMPSWRRGWGKRQKHYSRRSFCIRWGKLPQHRTVSSFLSYLYSPVGKFFELLCNCNIYVFVKLFTFSLEWVGSNYLTKKIILKSRDPNFFFFLVWENKTPTRFRVLQEGL